MICFVYHMFFSSESSGQSLSMRVINRDASYRTSHKVSPMSALCTSQTAMTKTCGSIHSPCTDHWCRSGVRLTSSHMRYIMRPPCKSNKTSIVNSIDGEHGSDHLLRINMSTSIMAKLLSKPYLMFLWQCPPVMVVKDTITRYRSIIVTYYC